MKKQMKKKKCAQGIATKYVYHTLGKAHACKGSRKQ